MNTLAIEVVAGSESRVMGLAPGLDDDLFENDGQLTKREVRALTLSSLAPRHGELLWDIGLGAGSIAIEWLLCDASLSAIGIEERADRAARAMRNALALGAPDLKVVTGRAPDVLAGLPAPDAVFIGGGLTDAGVFDAAWTALKPGGRLVANAVTLESEARLAELFSQSRRRADADRGRARRHRRRHARLAPGHAGYAMAGEEAMIVAGIGCRRGVSAKSIEDVIRVALLEGGLARRDLDALATHSDKGNEPGLREIAERWALSVILPGMSELESVVEFTKTISPYSLAAIGLAVGRRDGRARCRRAEGAPARAARRDQGSNVRDRRWRRSMTVHFIGAGPGAPDLITVRGRDLIARCPVCLYAGSLVPKALLDYCPPARASSTRRRCRSTRSSPSASSATDAGHDVARLHSGDLSIWSALGEQLRRLERSAFPTTITPGVPAFAAAAAALGQELTLPEVAQSVVLTRTPGRASAMPPKETLAAFAATRATLAIHLSIHALAETVAELLPHYGADCPVAVV